MAKSNTQTWEFEGPVKYAKIYEPDSFRGSERYMINVYLDERQRKHYERSGIQGGIKTDEDGDYVVFRRDTSKKMGKDLVEFTPPSLYDTDGTPLVTYVDQEGSPRNSFSVKDNVNVTQKGERVNIGNGSVCKVRVSVYDTSMGKGCRLENIKLVDLIEYKAGGSVISADNTLGDEGGEEIPTVDFSDLEDKEQLEKDTKESATKKKKDTKKSDLPW